MKIWLFQKMVKSYGQIPKPSHKIVMYLAVSCTWTVEAVQIFSMVHGRCCMIIDMKSWMERLHLLSNTYNLTCSCSTKLPVFAGRGSNLTWSYLLMTVVPWLFGSFLRTNRLLIGWIKQEFSAFPWHLSVQDWWLLGKLFKIVAVFV